MDNTVRPIVFNKDLFLWYFVNPHYGNSDILKNHYWAFYLTKDERPSWWSRNNEMIGLNTSSLRLLLYRKWDIKKDR